MADDKIDPGQGEPAAGHRVPRRIHSWIGHALQILVDRDALLSVGHSCHLQIELVDLRRTPGGMHHQIGFDRVLLRSYPAWTSKWSPCRSMAVTALFT